MCPRVASISGSHKSARRSRIQAFVDRILDYGLKFTWAGTMRADQGVRLPSQLWERSAQSGLLAPNHYLSVMIDYLFQHRPQWSATAAVGKTVGSILIFRLHPHRVRDNEAG